MELKLRKKLSVGRFVHRRSLLLHMQFNVFNVS